MPNGRRYKNYPHVEVRATTPEFGDYLARSKGLIASPSRGVVTQVTDAHSRLPCTGKRSRPQPLRPRPEHLRGPDGSGRAP